jgi:hypothetical protein
VIRVRWIGGNGDAWADMSVAAVAFGLGYVVENWVHDEGLFLGRGI